MNDRKRPFLMAAIAIALGVVLALIYNSVEGPHITIPKIPFFTNDEVEGPVLLLLAIVCFAFAVQRLYFGIRNIISDKFSASKSSKS